MGVDFGDISAFLAVVKAGGFRDAARATGDSASRLSEAVRRLEARLGVRLLHRTTRSVELTAVGRELADRLTPAVTEVDLALDVVNGYRERIAGRLKLNVPISAARLVLPDILPPFLAAYPDIHLEIVAEDTFVDLVASGCDAGIRYDERLEQDMIAVPIGPRLQRYALAASSAYLDRCGRPDHPRDLIAHNCIRGRFASGAIAPWEFERDGEVVNVEPTGQLIVATGGAAELMVAAAIGGVGIMGLFEDWIRPHFSSGALEPVLEQWWPSFSGPFLYYPGRRLVPAPLRAFVDFVKARGHAVSDHSAIASSSMASA
ncbi:HTH-type transcriptional regulator PgrR [Pleomorphomonas sp. T1.2MG-36]|uniref:LysR family transcriptional regulator n=1 Tax=Pleomorphomonas sp. T1.2MG-36 TaxID=3041167 RepID=UPI002477CA88|nr:LysR family transcriptional regulator [Pleomorphomonas sp. T1.2MG-36]CAI9401529.1 HTH-type transcriptional regulator PgrR [Pleomorphomonas sp. T1.2MG-36]